jgi:AraC family transcriptional regulator
MENIYSDIMIRELKDMRLASYSIFSNNAEEEVISFIKNWVSKKGLDSKKLRYFGIDLPLTEKQQQEGVRGYEYCATIPNDITESDGVKIKNIPAGKYAVLRITDPFQNPMETIPLGYKRLYDWWVKSEYKNFCNPTKQILEEIIEDESKTYMDIYFPVE